VTTRPEAWAASILVALAAAAVAGAEPAETPAGSDAPETAASVEAPFDPLVRAELAAQRALARARGAAEAPAPFESDGCSGGLSAGWSVLARLAPGFAEAFGDLPPWEACCVAHDRLYHVADPDPAAADPAEGGLRARRAADAALRACVIATGAARAEADAARFGVTPAEMRDAYASAAALMHLAVRHGGGPCSGLPWRWGFGWPHCVATPSDFAAD
jgi:hypothetical protein